MSTKFILVCVTITLLSLLVQAQHFGKVESIFPKNVTVNRGDVIQCEVTKTNIEEVKEDYHVYTQACSTNLCYVYNPVTEKSFSFKVKVKNFPCIILSSVPYLVPNDKVEILLDVDSKYSAIRVTTKTGTAEVSKMQKGGIVNDEEYRGFWIRWLDDELLEVGHELETIPFLHYKFPEKLNINFVGLLTWQWTQNGNKGGAWIIDGDPKYPGSNETQVHKNMKTESDCFLLN